MALNLANQLTLSRLALLPVLIALFYVPSQWAAWTCLAIYIVAALTDWLDGFVARKFKLVSALGTFLDPIADKIFVIVVLLMLVAIGRITGVACILVIIILMREFIVSGLREYLGPLGIKVPVSRLAKWKTTVQMVATGLLIVAPYVTPFGIPFGEILGLACLTVAAALTAVTGWDYLRKSLPHLQD